jgi:hypothetical protein
MHAWLGRRAISAVRQGRRDVGQRLRVDSVTHVAPSPNPASIRVIAGSMPISMPRSKAFRSLEAIGQLDQQRRVLTGRRVGAD